MDVVGTFLADAGVLSFFGAPLDNTLTISRNAAGQILGNNGAIAIQGGTPTVANTAQIQVFGLLGAATITLDEANGALLFGGSGNGSGVVRTTS